MAACLACKKDIALSLDSMVKPVYCEHCRAGPFRVTRATGYGFALGLIAYFIFAVVVGVMILGVDPSAMFVHVHNAGSDGSFAALLFIGGFYIWVRYWTKCWSKKFAVLRVGA